MIDWTRLTPTVERAAGIAVSNFPAHHSISDVKQEMWVWIMENKNTITRILSDSEGTDTALVNLLVKAGQKHLKTEDAATYGYAEEDAFYYSLDLIKSILEVVFKHEDWQSFAASQDTQPKAKANPAHGGNNLASYADVSSAIDQLTDEQYNILVWRYKYQQTFIQIGAELGLSQHTARDRHNSAVTAIQGILGKRGLGELRNPPTPPSRPSTIASARAVTDRSYEG